MRTVLISVLFLALALPALAASPLQGSVVDSTGGAVVGAQVILGTSISAAQPLRGDRMLLATDAGTQLEVDEVVVAVGLSPNDTLGREAGLKMGPDGGVLVDADCRTSNENVFASGIRRQAVEIGSVGECFLGRLEV